MGSGQRWLDFVEVGQFESHDLFVPYKIYTVLYSFHPSTTKAEPDVKINKDVSRNPFTMFEERGSRFSGSLISFVLRFGCLHVNCYSNTRKIVSVVVLLTVILTSLRIQMHGLVDALTTYFLLVIAWCSKIGLYYARFSHTID